MIKTISGSLLNSKEQYIAHQCNSYSNNASGIADQIFEKYPYSNIYSHRPSNYKPIGLDLPGQIIIKGDGEENRFIINMIAQYYPGGPGGKNSPFDSAQAREEYFWKCLLEISKIDNLSSIAFPYWIGCGLAKGNWDNYLRMIKDFDILTNIGKEVTIFLYKKNT